MNTVKHTWKAEASTAVGYKPVEASRLKSSAAMEPAQRVGKVFFPLDEELGLSSSALTPHAQEGLVRLAAWVPFGPAAQLLEGLLGIQVSKASGRRLTLQAGSAGLQEWEEQTTALQKELPPVSAQASHQVMSADGAMVPLVAGEWAEVKTLVIGEVVGVEAGNAQVEHLSYCSRLSDVTGFERATLLETHRRGLEHAESVAAVTDGADWLQGFINYHRADAVRILDFAHAASYISAIGDSYEPPATGYPPTGWRESCIGSNTKDQSVFLSISATCACTVLIQRYAKSSNTFPSVALRCSIPAIRRQAGLSGLAWWKAPTSWSWRPCSKARGCIGSGRMSTPCCCYAMRYAMMVGRKPGRGE